MIFPIGIQSFDKIITGGYVYVDKTEFIYSLAHEGNVYFLSRPRRFGKSLLVSTLQCYFEGRKELFKGLAIEKLETEWKTYPVFRIDFNGTDFSESNILANNILGYVKGWERQYGVEPDESVSSGERFAKVLAEAHRQTGLRCVVLVDEYDKPLLDVMDSGKMVEFEGEKLTIEERNRNVLKAFYSTFKKADDDLQFVFLTGVTKFSQISVFSGFNQPRDISMNERYSTICGITEEEIDLYFQEQIEEFAACKSVSKVEMRKLLRRKYDGYHFCSDLHAVYNPFSLLNSLADLKLRNYWFSTGTPTYLVRLLNHFDENIDDIISKSYDSSQFVDYRADRELPLPMIYQSGYLTIKGYNRRREKYLLDFPNDEVRRGFVSILANNYLNTPDEVESWLDRLLDALDEADLEKFRVNLTAFLASIPYTSRRSSSEHEMERYFHYTFYLILSLASTYVVYTEKCQSQGRVDCVIETDDYIYIFEFKLNGTAQQALDQIESQGYAAEYAADPRQLFKVGCSFSSETGTISDFAVNSRSSVNS